MTEYYYLHLHASNLLLLNAQKKTVLLDSIPKDSIFQAGGFWGLPNLSTSFLKNQKLKIGYEKVLNIRFGENIKSNLSINVQDLPTFLYKLNFKGVAGQDEIGVYKNSHLIVSNGALDILRKEGIVNAESDLIDIPIEDYFFENRHYFWMPDKIRKKFVERFANKTPR